MDKQRLLKLAGLTEASHIGHNLCLVSIVYDTGEETVQYTVGLFNNRNEAERFTKELDKLEELHALKWGEDGIIDYSIEPMSDLMSADQFIDMFKEDMLGIE